MLHRLALQTCQKGFVCVFGALTDTCHVLSLYISSFFLSLKVNNGQKIRADMLRRIEIFKQKADHKDQLASNLEEARIQLKSRHTDTPDPHYRYHDHESSLALPPLPWSPSGSQDGSHFEEGSSEGMVKRHDNDAAEGWDW